MCNLHKIIKYLWSIVGCLVVLLIIAGIALRLVNNSIEQLKIEKAQLRANIEFILDTKNFWKPEDDVGKYILTMKMKMPDGSLKGVKIYEDGTSITHNQRSKEND